MNFVIFLPVKVLKYPPKTNYKIAFVLTHLAGRDLINTPQ